MKKNKKIYIIFTILISIFSISIVNKCLQNDTFSAIKIGDYILEHGIDFTEHFNIQNDLIYHNARYLFNIIVALAYNNFSYFGVYFLACLITIIIGNTMFNAFLKLKNNIIVSFLVTLISLYCGSSFFTARAQIFSYLFLFIELYSIERLIDTNHKKYALYIIISSILIANIHTTIWPMTLIIFLPYFMEYILSKIKNINKFKRIYFDEININLLLTIFIITALSGLCTPLGALPYTYMFKTLSGVSTIYIAELQKVNIFSNFSIFFYTIIYIVLFVYLKLKIKISDLFLVTGLYFMSVMAYRNIAFLIILTAIPMARLITNLINCKTKKADDIMLRVIDYNFVLIPVSIFILLISFCNFCENNLLTKYIYNDDYPIKAAKFINTKIDKEKMILFNEFDYGSYLEFKDIKVFLDSRSEIFCKEFNDTNILNDHYSVFYGLVNYKTVFNKYGFTHILLKKEKRRNMINLYIAEDSDYTKIYEDESFIIYERIR